MTELFTRSARLFADAAFMDGAARIFDLFGAQDVYNIDATPQEADAKAIYSDWASVGDELIVASGEAAQSNAK